MIMALIALLFVLLPSLIALSRSEINDFRDGWGERSLLTDVVVLTPSDEKRPSAYPSAKLNSATSTNQNLPSKFWKVTSADLGAE
jgi:hypothetical protein